MSDATAMDTAAESSAGGPHSDAVFPDIKAPRSKRALDLLLLIIAHLFPPLLPVWIVLWLVVPLAIILDDGWPVFYAQRRVGRGGRVFQVLKFRTMRVSQAEGESTILAVRDDPRITRVGKILRRTAIDELPQVLSILKGDMSFVGPRPEPPDVNERLQKLSPNAQRRYTVRPGLTGLAQIRGGYHARLRDKLRYDLLYIQNINWWLDVKLILKSVWRTISATWDTPADRWKSRSMVVGDESFPIKRRYKRPLDLLILSSSHLILAPLLILLWILLPLLIWLEDRGPILFVQERIGMNGRSFPLYKFRTMRRRSSDETWLGFTTDDDIRLTRVGRVLRRLALDELPQVINLWKGDMSFVGPRPLPTEMHDEYTQENPDFVERLRVTPGLTGLSQIHLPRHVDASTRLQYDLIYVRKSNLFLDLKLIIQSIWFTLTGRWGRGLRRSGLEYEAVLEEEEQPKG